MNPRPDLARIDDLIARNRLKEALTAAEQSLARKPGDIDLISILSFILFKTGDLPRAEHFARQLAHTLPTSGHAQHNLGNCLLKLGRTADALPILTRALELEPNEINIFIALADCLTKLNRSTDALHTIDRALQLVPNDPRLLRSRAHALHNRGRIELALPIYQSLAVSHPADLDAAASICSALNYSPTATREQTLAAHRRFAELLTQGGGNSFARPKGAGSPRGKNNPLRVGILSPDLRDHAVGHLIANFIEHTDRSLIHIGCYTTTGEDAVSARLKAQSDNWRLFRGATFASIADAIIKDKVDLLLDLAGHTNGNLLATLALRPAPVQCTYTGYPNTTGLSAVDFRIVDSLTDPAGYEAFATERLLRLDPCYMSYRPPDPMPDITPLPAGDHGPITFASFSSLLKYNEPLLKLWSRVLAAVPNSRLVLMHTALTDEGVRNDLRARFASHGVDPARIILQKPQPSRDGVFRAYQSIDIGLDTAPYNGGVTLAESLLMGVPFITLVGHTSAARTGLSVLSAVDLPDLCAHNEDQYIQLAAGLAADRSRLTKLRANLRSTILSSCICNGPGFARRFENLLFEAWKNAVPTA